MKKKDSHENKPPEWSDCFNVTLVFLVSLIIFFSDNRGPNLFLMMLFPAMFQRNTDFTATAALVTIFFEEMRWFIVLAMIIDVAFMILNYFNRR